MKYITLFILNFIICTNIQAGYDNKSNCEADKDQGLFYYYGRNTKPLKRLIGKGYSTDIRQYNYVSDDVKTLDKAAKEAMPYLVSMAIMIYKLPKNMSDKAVKLATYDHCMTYYRLK